MSKREKIVKIKEYLRQLVIRELNENFIGALTEHERSGENMKVFSYETQNFDICKSAGVLFNKLIQLLNAQSKSNDEFQANKTHIVMAAKYLDEFLGIEKQVVKQDASSAMDMKRALELSNLFSLKIGVVGGRAKIDVSKELGFLPMHFQQIQKRHYGSKVKDVEEVSTTATAGIDGTGTGHYDSPHAFSSKKKKKDRRNQIAKTGTNFEIVNEVTGQEFVAINKIVTNLNNIQKSYQRATGIGDKELKDRKYNKHYETILAAKKSMISLLDILKTKQMLGEGRYHDWKRDESLSPKQKIGRSMREIRDALNELDKTVKMNLKLKTELNMSSQDYWKNTHKALTKISERLVKMANKVGNLK